MSGKKDAAKARKLAALANDKAATAGERAAAEAKLGRLAASHIDAVATALEDAQGATHGATARYYTPPSPKPAQRAPESPPEAPRRDAGKWSLPEQWVDWRVAYRLLYAYVMAHARLLNDYDYIASISPNLVPHPTKNMARYLCGRANEFLGRDAAMRELDPVRQYVDGHLPIGHIPDWVLFKAAEESLHRDWQVTQDGAY